MKFRLFGGDSCRDKVLCGLAAALFPTVIFVYFCARNIGEIPAFQFTAWASSFIFATAGISYLGALLIFKKSFPALVFCSVCWLGIYLEPVLSIFFGALPLMHGKRLVETITILAIASYAALLARGFKRALNLTSFSVAVLFVILALNVTTLIYAFAHGNGLAFPLKKDFAVDLQKKSPNIYWIHPDGMLGVDMVEKYFGDKQEEFLAGLEEHGLVVNPRANFEAGHLTSIAIPILTNPYSYDNLISDFTKDPDEVRKLNGDTMRFLRMNGELQNAFSAKQYGINVIGIYDFYYPAKDGQMWIVEHRSRKFSKRKILSYEQLHSPSYERALLSALGMRNIHSNAYLGILFSFVNFDSTWAMDENVGKDYRVQMPDAKCREILINGWDDPSLELDFTRALYDVLYGDYPQPRLTIVHDGLPHFPFAHDMNGKPTKDPDNMDPLDYYPQHLLSAKVLLGVIDMILEVDPDAVIVIQSDHGLHGNTEADFKAAFGEKANPLELWNSTMSAIRVPPQYQTGEEHYAMENPLNISRYLVNSFVGKNYEYLPPNETF